MKSLSMIQIGTSNLQHFIAQLKTDMMEHPVIEPANVSNDDDNDIIILMFSDIDTVNESTTCDEFNYNYNF